MSAAALSAADEVRIRAAANEWIGATFPTHRRHLAHTRPAYSDGKWTVRLVTQRFDDMDPVVLPGTVFLSADAAVVESTVDVDAVCGKIDRLASSGRDAPRHPAVLQGNGYEFRFGDGLEGMAALDGKSIDLLLTDPPYGISNPYVCEAQVSRRLRSNGGDFIMPKGSFGDWDAAVDPKAWTAEVLPKVGGWAVIFCAHAQIGEYAEILTGHKFNAVVPMVWKKTNRFPSTTGFGPSTAGKPL